MRRYEFDNINQEVVSNTVLKGPNGTIKNWVLTFKNGDHMIVGIQITQVPETGNQVVGLTLKQDVFGEPTETEITNLLQ